ncbi:hypothetical protein [Chryseobacterium cucumeris]|uniref:hypothetical protein n=1 Tax=Chryseobacterium cucumeris TaxID=1813611 RepID=UPI0037BF4DD7
MKIIEKKILEFQENSFFSPIRNKTDYVKVLMLGARQLLLDIDNEDASSSKMRLVIDKMSRLFFYKEKKYFSISFPFTVIYNEDQNIEINSYSGKKIDNKSISAIISIVDSPEFKLNPSIIDFYIEPNNIVDSNGLFLLEEIFMFEPSYVRYDNDPDNENGNLHPLNHIDLNYSQYSTFKIGLNQNISEIYFENLHNIKTDCSFLTD